MIKELCIKVIPIMVLYTSELILIFNIKISIIYTILLIMIGFGVSVYLIVKVINNAIKKEKKRDLERTRDMVASHTIFNFINTISYLCRKDTDKARESLVHLSNYLRKSFKNEEETWMLDEESSLIESYLFMQKIRFKEKMEIEYSLESLCGTVEVYYIFNKVKFYVETSYKANYKVFKLIIKNNDICIVRLNSEGEEESINIRF